MNFIDELFGGKPEAPPEEFFSWLVQNRLSSFGPQFSTRVMNLSKDMRKAADTAVEQKNPEFKKLCIQYADALEIVSRFNAAQSMAVINELERLVNDNPAKD